MYPSLGGSSGIAYANARCLRCIINLCENMLIIECRECATIRHFQLVFPLEIGIFLSAMERHTINRAMTSLAQRHSDTSVECSRVTPVLLALLLGMVP